MKKGIRKKEDLFKNIKTLNGVNNNNNKLTKKVRFFEYTQEIKNKVIDSFGVFFFSGVVLFCLHV